MSEQQTARQQQSAPRASCASPNNPLHKAWSSSTKTSTFLCSFLFPPPRICYFSKVWPRPPFLCPPVSLTGVDAQRILRQPPQSAGWVLSPSLPPCVLSHHPPNLPLLSLFISQPPRSHSACLADEPLRRKVRAAWLTDDVLRGLTSLPCALL